jgi:hypothetical protein
MYYWYYLQTDGDSGINIDLWVMDLWRNGCDRAEDISACLPANQLLVKYTTLEVGGYLDDSSTSTP